MVLLIGRATKFLNFFQLKDLNFNKVRFSRLDNALVD